MLKVVRKCYKQLSNSDKYVYEILTEYDFEDKINGKCKGYIFPNPSTIAIEYNLSLRTLYRHLAQLEKAGLIKRIRRQYRGSVIQLLDISENMLSTYRNKRHLPKMASEYSSKLLNNRRVFASVATVEFLFTAREYSCYERLLAWGYHPTQAIRDITNPKIGIEKVEQRLTDLHTVLAAGWTPRQSFAQWLNWALRCNDKIATRGKETYPSADRPARSRVDIAEFEEYTDEQGYINYRPMQTNPVGEPDKENDLVTNSLSHEVFETISKSHLSQAHRTFVALDECDSIRKLGINDIQKTVQDSVETSAKTPFNQRGFILPNTITFYSFLLPSSRSLRLTPSQLDHPQSASLNYMIEGGRVDRPGQGSQESGEG